MESPVRRHTDTTTPLNANFLGHLISNFNSKDATERTSWLGAEDLTDWSLFRSATIEFFGTAAFFFLHVMILTTATQLGYDQPAGPIGLAHGIALTVFIFAFAAPSGAHLNPLITLSTVLCGLTTFSRGVTYIIFQVAGAVVIGRSLRAIEFAEDAKLVYGVCTSNFKGGSAVILEFFFDMFLLFPAYGVAFDRQQADVYGPILAPIVIGTSLGLAIWVSSGMIDFGYVWGGNPALCMGSAVGASDWKDTWVVWVGALLASAVHSLLYLAVPPNHEQICVPRSTKNLYANGDEKQQELPQVLADRARFPQVPPAGEEPSAGQGSTDHSF